MSNNQIVELIKSKGFEISNESWYDEEGIEGCRISRDDTTVLSFYGHTSDDDFFEKLKEELNTYKRRGRMPADVQEINELVKFVSLG